jgi:hypothetical protein
MALKKEIVPKTSKCHYSYLLYNLVIIDVILVSQTNSYVNTNRGEILLFA